MTDEPVGDYPSRRTVWLTILIYLITAIVGITGALIWNF
jgi:hypothetical protein